MFGMIQSVKFDPNSHEKNTVRIVCSLYDPENSDGSCKDLDLKEFVAAVLKTWDMKAFELFQW